ncbi:MAG: hypothetical protein AB7L09_18275 [Nitrospira sp.]
MAPITALNVNADPGVGGMGAESNRRDCDKATMVADGSTLIEGSTFAGSVRVDQPEHRYSGKDTVPKGSLTPTPTPLSAD